MPDKLTVAIARSKLAELPDDMPIGMTDVFGDFEAFDADAFSVESLKAADRRKSGAKEVLAVSCYDFPHDLCFEEPD